MSICLDSLVPILNAREITRPTGMENERLKFLWLTASHAISLSQRRVTTEKI